jgi:hypothetical protein
LEFWDRAVCFTDDDVELMLACRTAWAGIELGKELLEMFESSDMMLVLLDTAVRPSLDLYILFRATNRNEDMIS